MVHKNDKRKEKEEKKKKELLIFIVAPSKILVIIINWTSQKILSYVTKFLFLLNLLAILFLSPVFHIITFTTKYFVDLLFNSFHSQE